MEEDRICTIEINKLDLRGKENVMMIWRGVEKKKQEIAKKIVLHPYPIPITDPTHLVEVCVFLFQVSQNISSYKVPVLSSTYATAYWYIFTIQWIDRFGWMYL